ncbi:universal stress protein [Actimicrobium sp. CCC2.4]|uniref:universal stress protein n=1 Tax=Actimicrobium sp. CCC2.4 TaxID=3048606 RepID=UPI002AC9196A|nr:universal stress protein [Actimicrobium sp. CCC2.4]MEB0136803.1 universal stress protein [Actimicrobium sp. CCC2.4]WPX33919.1 universal stress protein [Actimicrobium sp. CCC2.4]
MNQQIIACIDQSGYSTTVCDYAVWAAQRLEAPLQFAHVLDRVAQPASHSDLSGNIGLGSREDLLDQLAALDEQRNRIAQEGGRLLLDSARARAHDAGIAAPQGHQWHGELVDTLLELEHDVRLFVVGQRGDAADQAARHLGGNLERVVRALHRPILVVPATFVPVHKIMIAFDASATADKGIALLATSPLFRGLSCAVVMVGAETDSHRIALEQARRQLAGNGLTVTADLLPGDADHVLADYARTQAIDLMVMGAYGHSRLRQLILGSTTTTLLRTTRIPILLLR